MDNDLPNNVTISYDQGDDAAEHTAIEEASVIHLLRVLMAGTAPPAASDVDRMEYDRPGEPEAEPTDNMTAEEAGCMLWDMSASRAVARVMLRNRALEALEIVIARELLVAQVSEGLAALDADREGQGRGDTARAAAVADTTPCNIAPKQRFVAAAPATAANTTPEAEAVGRRSPGASSRQLARLRIQNALRILEICLGTLANLLVTQPAASAEASSRPDLLDMLFAPPAAAGTAADRDVGAEAEEEAEAVAGRSGKRGGEALLLDLVGDEGNGTGGGGGGGGALYVDDARVLSELFRLCSFALRCQGASSWLAALTSPPVLRRLMWVGAATTDAQLFSRFLDMLVAVLHASAKTAADAAAAAPTAIRSPGTNPEPAAVCECLLGCGLLELVHGVLRQSLVACLPAEEKYGTFAGLEDNGYDSVSCGGGGMGPPMAAVALAGASPPLDAASSAPSVAASTAPSDRTAGADVQSVVRPVAGGGGGRDETGTTTARGASVSSLNPKYSTQAGTPEKEDEAVAAVATGTDAVNAAAAAAAAEAAAAAAAAAGPVPLSDEAVDAALRLIEELVAPEGPLSGRHVSVGPLDRGAPVSGPGPAGAAAENGDSAAAAAAAESGGPVDRLLRLALERRLRPGLVELMLGLLRYQYDSMQILESLLVVLVDLGSAVQRALASAPPADIAATAARLAEVLQDSAYGTSSGAVPTSVVQLQQGAWYLLAAALRGGAKSASVGAGAVAAGKGSWRKSWQSFSCTLTSLQGLPRPEGCDGYVRACCAAGMQLAELQSSLASGPTANGGGSVEKQGGGQGAGVGTAGGHGLGEGEAEGEGEAGGVAAERVRVTLEGWVQLLERGSGGEGA